MWLKDPSILWPLGEGAAVVEEGRNDGENKCSGPGWHPGSAPPQPSSGFGRGWSLRVAQDLKAGSPGGLGGKIL